MEERLHFLDGGGEMADAIRTHDWERTPLGPLRSWPSALKIALSMALNSKFPKCIAWGPELVSFHNDAFRPILGNKKNALGRPFPQIWREVWPTVRPIMFRALQGEATFVEDMPLLVNRYGFPEKCNFTFCYSPIRDESGVVRGVLDTVVETTDTVATQERLRLLNGELGHRIVNTLAVVSAIISQTLHAHVARGDLAAESLQKRIRALAQAQALLTGPGRSGASIRRVVEQALAPFQGDHPRFRISGPDLRLPARPALTLALALNELATNALKYGALSVPEGRVRLHWSAGRPGSDEMFVMTWEESGGPGSREPGESGFGSIIIEQALAADFRGDSRLHFERAGLRHVLRTRMRNLDPPHPPPD